MKNIKTFIYGVFYPALLGSMTYDVIKEFVPQASKIDSFRSVEFLTPFLIWCIFIVDWFFMNTIKRKSSIKGKFLFVDVVIPVVLTYSFFHCSFPNLFLILLLYFTSFVTYTTFSTENKNNIRGWVRTVIIVYALLMLVLFLLNVLNTKQNCCISKDCSEVIGVVLLCLFTLFYLVLTIAACASFKLAFYKKK